MEPTLRPAARADREALSEIFREENDRHADLVPEFVQRADPVLTAGELDALLDREDRLFMVAETGGRVVGAVLATLVTRSGDRFLKSRRIAYVEEIAVLRAAQRQGVGRRLMQGVTAWARENGASGIELNVWQRNQEAAGFYRSLGYETSRLTMFRDLE